MRSEDFNKITLSRYELRLLAREECRLPSFLGSTLRGAFGHALREAVRAIDHGDCCGCSAADPCAYHYLFETPVPPGVTQLRGQREAPVPFILSPPIVQNPVRRVWRVPAVKAAGALSGSAELGGFARNPSNPQSETRNPKLGDPRSSIPNSQFSITSVEFPDRPRRFAAGDTLSFDLVLIGRATEYLRYVVLAFAEMAHAGLGANRAKFELREVWLRDSAQRLELIYENGVLEAPASRLPGAKAERSRLFQIARPLSELIRERLAELKGARSEEPSSASPSLEGLIAEAIGELRCSDPQPPTPDPSTRRVRFLTPARIRVNGDLQTDLSFELLVRNLLRRVSTLAAVHGRGAIELDYRGLIDRAASVKTRSSRLVWWDLDRYSNRQQTKMKLGGFIGEVEYEGEAVEEFLPLLVAGELLNIGTGTSFGLGCYRILECE
ncbi:MAG: CRISPR system precrRNA processing endoribonuclease RAMP protein Cas6 [Acidobacteriota bacterium]